MTEGIYSMLGDSAPLREIAEIKREMGATLIVDEAHSLGIRGKNGRGVCEDAGVEADVDFVVGTFSKSLGAIGGSRYPICPISTCCASSVALTCSRPLSRQPWLRP